MAQLSLLKTKRHAVPSKNVMIWLTIQQNNELIHHIDVEGYKVKRELVHLLTTISESIVTLVRKACFQTKYKMRLAVIKILSRHLSCLYS